MVPYLSTKPEPLTEIGMDNNVRFQNNRRAVKRKNQRNRGRHSARKIKTKNKKSTLKPAPQKRNYKGTS